MSRHYSRGHTLIELLVIGTIIALVYTIILRNFSHSRAALEETANQVLADVRLMQGKAIAGSQYGSVVRCGYGIAQVTATDYRLYVAPQPNAGNGYCSGLNQNYNGGEDLIYENKDRSLTDPKLEFKTSFSDIFFEPPDPRVYVNDVYNLGGPPERITIGPIGQACNPANLCRSICVYRSGKVDVGIGSTCP